MINFNSMQFWLAALGVLIAIVVLFAIARGRHERRRSRAEMRDYMRRNFRIGQHYWE